MEKRTDLTLRSKKSGVCMRQTARKSIIIAASVVVLSVIVLAAHWPALKSEAVFFDDGEYLVQNRLVKNPSWFSARRFLTEVLEPSTVRGYYHPLAMISLMFDYAVGGRVDYLMPFHRTSLCLHVANVLLVVVLFYLLFGRYLPALIIGILFGLHPLNADSVVWIAERKTVLAGFFTLCSIVLYLLFTKSGKKRFFLPSVAAYILAVMSKPTSIMLPFLLLLLDFWPLRRTSKRTLVEKIPFFIIFLAAGAVIFASQDRAANVTVPFDAPLVQVPMLLCHNIGFYLFKAIWPVGISAYYPFPEPFEFSHPSVVAGLIGTAVVFIALALSVRKTYALITGWLFFFVAILPAMGVLSFTDVIVANRFMYLPILGFLLPTGLFLRWLLYDRRTGLSLTLRWILTAAVVVVLVCSQFRATFNYLRNWQDGEKLYRYMISVSPHSAKLYNNLGNVLPDGDIEAKIRCYEKAIALDANQVRAYINLGNVYGRIGRADEAIDYYKKALMAPPDQAVRYYIGYYNLGLTYAEKGDFKRAIACYEEAIRLKGDFVLGYEYWAVALANLGKIDEAIDKLSAILRIEPTNVKACCNIGILLEQQGKVDEAISQYRRALEINPGDNKARELLEAASKRQKIR